MTQVYKSPYTRTDTSEARLGFKELQVKYAKMDERRKELLANTTKVGSEAWKAYSTSQDVATSDHLAETFDVTHELYNKGGDPQFFTEKLNIYEKTPEYQAKSWWKKPFTPSGGRVQLTDEYIDKYTFSDDLSDWDVDKMTPEQKKIMMDRWKSGEKYLHSGEKPAGYIGDWGGATPEGAETMKESVTSAWSAVKEGNLGKISKSIAPDLGTWTGKAGFGLEAYGDIMEWKDKKPDPIDLAVDAAKYFKYYSPDPLSQGIGWGATIIDMLR